MAIIYQKNNGTLYPKLFSMKRFLPLIVVIAVLILAFKPFIDPLPIGASLPKADLKMKDISGKDISLKDAQKKNGLLVMFSCNTCPWVIKNQSRTNEIGNYAISKEVGVILLNSNEGQRNEADSYNEMKEYAKGQGYKWYYAVDEKSILANEFGANRTPECFLFNKDGKLVYHGAIDDNPANAGAVSRKHLKEAIDEMNTGKEISVKESRSMGCAIQRVE
jgi:thioredoxin-related protein